MIIWKTLLLTRAATKILIYKKTLHNIDRETFLKIAKISARVTDKNFNEKCPGPVLLDCAYLFFECRCNCVN